MRKEAKASGRIIFLPEKHRKRGENVRNYRYLTFGDREKIETEYAAGGRPADIAIGLGVHVATIYKELKRGDTGQLDKNMRRQYSAELAQRRLIESFKCRGRKSPTI
jgi:IS30 family transposase